MRGKRKFTDAQVIEIKQHIKENKVKTEWLRKKYSCSKQDINNIKNEGYYKYLDKFIN